MSEAKLQVRGHRVLVLKNHATRLAREGKAITPATLACASDPYDFAQEAEEGHYDYSDGTVSGRINYSLGKQKHTVAILTAPRDTLVKVNGNRDDTCFSCASFRKKHCDFPLENDNPAVLDLADFACDCGHDIAIQMNPHPLNPTIQEASITIPAGVIQDFVYGRRSSPSINA